MTTDTLTTYIPQETDGKVEQNVIGVITSENKSQGDNPLMSSQGDSASSSRHSRSPPPGTINMTALRTALPDIELNSPSRNIIGTPFAHTTTNTPFEYPFPETSPEAPSFSSPYPSLNRPGSPPYPPPHPPIHSIPPSELPPPSHTTIFNLIPPKFRSSTSPSSPPPMPPSLKKKRWSLNLLGRRRSSNPPTPGDGPTSPGTPPAVSSGALLSGLGSGRPPKSGQSPESGFRPLAESPKGGKK